MATRPIAPLPDIQQRAESNKHVIREYSDMLQNGATFPPVVTFSDGTDYWLADGFQRCEASLKAGQKVIQAEVRQGTRRDALLYAASANATHGLRRTNADKRRAVATLLQDDEWREWSDRVIARHCGVDHKFVGKLRGELSGDIPRYEEPKERTVQRGDTTYKMNTENIGTAQKNGEATDAEIVDAPGSDTDAPHIAGTTKPKSPPVIDVEAEDAPKRDAENAPAHSVAISEDDVRRTFEKAIKRKMSPTDAAQYTLDKLGHSKEIADILNGAMILAEWSAEEQSEEVLKSAIDRISPDQHVGILTYFWQQIADDSRTAFLLDIGAMTLLQDPRRSDKDRIIDAFQQATGKTVTGGHIADMTDIDAQKVSQIIFRLKKQGVVKEVRKGEYSTKIKS